MTVRDRGVSKSLSFSPKAGGDEAIIGALSGMDLTVPQDEHMIDCEVNDDDILGMDLMEMENGNSSVMWFLRWLHENPLISPRV